jgi:hypothetical protein
MSNLNPSYWDAKNDTGMKVNGEPINVSNIFIKQGNTIPTNAKEKDFLYFSYNTLKDDEDMLNDEGFYVRFGHLIEFIRDNIILKYNPSGEPIIGIDKDFETARMYVFPFQVSLDPRVCIVGTKEKISQKTFFDQLPVWNTMDGRGAFIANIYLNCAMVNKVLSEKQDEEGNVSLYEILNTICSELNRALGNINNLETIINEETNSIKIIDSSLLLPKPKSTKLELYGYNGNKSNFVYDFNIKTEITNDFATMVTIGATAGGYAKGTENTMFSKWNKGLEDIFKDDYIPPKQTSTNDDKDPPNNTYASEFWMKRYAPFGLTYPQDIEWDVLTPDACALSPEIIDKNIELVSEFYKYCQYKIQQKYNSYASPTNGFIPISLGITLEGISGIKIYNAVNVDTRFLPTNYLNNLNFIIKGVNHKIIDGRWETNLETVVIAKSGKEGLLTYSQIKDVVEKEIAEGVKASKENKAEVTTHVQPKPIAPLTWESLKEFASTLIFTNNPDGNNNPLTPGGTGTQGEQESLAAAGSLLEQKTKQAAINHFTKHKESNGQCGFGATSIAIILGNLLTGQNNPYRGGNHAYSSTIRDNWNKIGIYKPESCTQPVFTNVSNSVIKKYIKDTQFNYGDGMVYFTNPPGVKINDKAKYHAQIYTGNMYKSLGSVGWSTDSKKNYRSSFVYSSFDSSKAIWSMYHFRIKDEYKGKTVTPTKINYNQNNNSGAKVTFLGYSFPAEMVKALEEMSATLVSKDKGPITKAHIDAELRQEGGYWNNRGSFDPAAKTKFEAFLKFLKEEVVKKDYNGVKPGDIKPTGNGTYENGYRTFAKQISNFMGGISGKTISQRQQYVAFPGFSQHHTGHCVDICSTNTDWWDKRPKFNKLVKDNCGKYGIQVTYQAANGGIGPTSGGIRWGEPWHIYIKDYQQNDSKNI